jgi:hypothetical protein
MADPVVARYLGGQPMSPEETVRRMLASAGCWMLRGYGYWAVTEKADDRMIGHVGLADFSRAITPSIAGQPEAGETARDQAAPPGHPSAGRAPREWSMSDVGEQEILDHIDVTIERLARVRAEIGREVAHARLQRRLGHAHDVVVRRDALGAGRGRSRG